MNLLETIKSYLTPELIGQAAQLLGENENGVAKALGGMAPTILAGVLNKSGDAQGMAQVFDMLGDERNAGFLDQLGSLIGGGNLAHNDPKDLSGQLMGALFGSKVQTILNTISAFAGIKSNSTSSLLGLAGPLVMGILQKKISGEGLNISGLLNLLNGEKSSILGALPSGLVDVIGLKGGVTIPSTEEPATGYRWVWPLFLLIALGMGIIYYMKTCTTRPAEIPSAATIQVDTVPAAPAATELTFPAGTEEADMLAFIRDANAQLDKNKWFNFPEIMFDVNKATLKPESELKLNAVLSMLKEFPALQLKIGGYTDSDGNDKANLKLSDERAKACLQWLVEKGVAAERLTAEGYGEQHPVAPNDSPENKAKNRRISFSVRAK